MPVVTGNTTPVPQGNVSLTITGVFPLPYEVAPSASWPTALSVTGKTATQFTLSFAVPAPANATIDYIIVNLPVPQPLNGAMLAGDIIMNVRDEIPDPTYDTNGNPLPDADGMFRAKTMYGWLDDGVRIMARLMGSAIEDWTAIAQVNNQPWYSVQTHFRTIYAAFSNQWPINLTDVSEQDVIWPSTSQATSQSLWGYLRKQTDHIEFGLWPIPELTDPLTTLVNPIGISGAPSIDLADTTNFLSFGYVLIDQEIIQYQILTPTSAPAGSLTVLSRGVCGTSATVHQAGAAVQHLGLWLKGTRSPARIVNSTSVVELPLDVVSDVKTYLLARCRGAENEYEERSRLMKEFNAACAAIRADPSRKENQGRSPDYGGPGRWGPVYYPAGGGVIVP